MAVDLEDIIKGSIAEISEDSGGDNNDEVVDTGEADGTDTSGGNGADDDAATGETVEGDKADESAAEKTEETADEDAAAAAEDLLSAEDKTLLSDLKELGIKIKDINVNNRMPYKRHLRVLVNEAKRVRERIGGEHTKVLTERDQKVAAAEARAKEAADLEALA